MSVQHFVGLSGGKDSLLTAIEALDRFERKPPLGNLLPRFVAADTGNEEHRWQNYIAYLERTLGITIEIVRADFSREFAVRRSNIENEWRKEKRTRTHDADCKSRGKKMTYRERMKRCCCPERVSPPVPEHLIQRALGLLHPTGNPFLDLCMLKGRFPGAMSRFCTDRLKIEPMMALKRPYLEQGINIVEWLGERAEESPDRAKKPILQRIRHEHASQIIYRPIHLLRREEVFARIAHRGIEVHPLYGEGASRLGCWPCIMCGKDEVAMLDAIAIERLREWEAIVAMVSRRQLATFFCAKVLPGPTGDDPGRAHIDAVVEWSKTNRGGKQFDMMQMRLLREAEDTGVYCSRESFAGCRG